MTPQGTAAEAKRVRRLTSSLIACLAAVVVPGASYFGFSQAFPKSEPSLLLVGLVSLLVWAGFGFVLGRYANALWVLFLALVSICVGVSENANYDARFHSYEHNLYPIEIVFFAILVMPGMLCGVVAARWIKSRAISN